MPGAGNLRFRVRFEKQVEVEAPAGGTTSSWVAQFTRWADIRPMKGGEGVIGQRLAGIQPALIIVRYDSETKQITNAWRAVEVESEVPVRFYALHTAADMERNREHITMVAEEGAADA